MRDFGGDATKSLLRGEDPTPVSSRTNSPAPQRNQSPTPAGGRIRRPDKNAHTPLFTETAGSKVAPTSGRESRSLFLNNPLSDGSRHMPQKRMFTPQTTPERAPSPIPRKRVIQRPDSIEGCSMTVVTEPKARTPHRIERYHTQTGNFEIDQDNTMEGGFHKQLTKVGLLGYGPTGKRRIQPRDMENLLDHPDSAPKAYYSDPRAPPKKTGTQMVPGKSHSSVVVWDLKSYTPEELNERKFKPSSVHLEGPPPFIPNSPQRRTGSPCRRRIDPGTSDIFPCGDAPVIRNPHSPALVRGRSPGRYSPLRQQPPSAFPRT